MDNLLRKTNTHKIHTVESCYSSALHLLSSSSVLRRQQSWWKSATLSRFCSTTAAHVNVDGLFLLLHFHRQRSALQRPEAASRTSSPRQRTPALRTRPPTTWRTTLTGRVRAASRPREAELQPRNSRRWCISARAFSTLWLKCCFNSIARVTNNPVSVIKSPLLTP